MLRKAMRSKKKPPAAEAPADVALDSFLEDDAARGIAGLGGRIDLAEKARIELEQQIVTLELPPGSVWTEADLSKKLGIGRTPVREALQRLESDYLVEIVPRLGARIRTIDIQQQLLSLEVRRVLERLIAVRAARHCTEAEREKCRELARIMDSLVDAEVLVYLRYHLRMKRYVSDCARNPFVARAIAPLHAMSRRFYYRHYRRAHDLHVAANRHAEVLRAIADGDEKAAAEMSDRLMDYVEEITRAALLRDL
jgi:DNA-binding GntR family transcriptional regulator